MSFSLADLARESMKGGCGCGCNGDNGSNCGCETPTSKGLRTESFKTIMTKIISEGNYKTFKSEENGTLKQKINNKISEVNSDLIKLERSLVHALRLKTEANIDSTGIWKSTGIKTYKMAERINKIQKLVMDVNN